MMSRTLKTTLAVAAAAVLIPGVAAAQMGDRLTQRDFERCHVQAMQVAGVRVESPAASPGMTGPSGTVAPHGTATQPGTSAVVTPPATSPGPAPGASGTGSGTETTRSGGLGVGTQSGTGPGSGGTMSTGASLDRAQQVERASQAYRDCLTSIR
jgi:hypothetical protein